MSNFKISLIACISKNRGLGLNNQLLYKIPEDQKFFREKTKGAVVIMGKNTFLSIGHPLPNRFNIVITRDENFKVPDVIVCHSVNEALNETILLAKNQSTSLTAVREVDQNKSREIFIIGGAQIYQQTIDKADKLYLTVVDNVKEADAFFPAYDEFKKTVFKKDGQYQGLKYTFLELEK